GRERKHPAKSPNIPHPLHGRQAGRELANSLAKPEIPAYNERTRGRGVGSRSRNQHGPHTTHLLEFYDPVNRISSPFSLYAAIVRASFSCLFVLLVGVFA